jgi:hypothetical protein
MARRYVVVTLERTAEKVWRRREYVVEASSRGAAATLAVDQSNHAWFDQMVDGLNPQVVSVVEFETS